ncbi:sialin-like [Ornithodoros turicata]|uniref:sialin-like n=1 Tax=Ornithodoros turicata TaxID=34597 RepID=UPI003139D652
MLCQTKCCLPYRYVIAALIAIGSFCAYTHRINFNLVVVALASRGAKNQSTPHGSCNHSHGTVEQNSVLFQEPLWASTILAPYTKTSQHAAFSWTESQQDIMLSAFFYGYMAPQLFSGLAADIATPKHMLSISIVFPGLISFLTPMAVQWHWEAVTTLRALMGLAQGFMTASQYMLASYWAPKIERARILSICFVGSSIGSIVAMPTTGFLIQSDTLGGWPSTFYLFGAVTIIWFLLWSVFAANRPEDHRCVPHEQYISLDNLDNPLYQKVTPPWKAILTSGPVWGIVAAKTGASFGLSAFLTKVPAFMDRILCMGIMKNSIMNAVLYAAMALGMVLWGYVADKMRQRSLLSTTNIRRIFSVVCFYGSAACIVAVPYVGSNWTTVSLLLIVFMVFYSAESGAHLPNIVDISPRFSGTVFGVANTFASAGALISPLVASHLLHDEDDPVQWSYYFYTCAGVHALAGLIYVALCSSEMQKWVREAASEEDESAADRADER